jgi:hypothetical protein
MTDAITPSERGNKMMLKFRKKPVVIEAFQFRAGEQDSSLASDAAPDLVAALHEALDIIIWMSGSPSFSPEGEAHVGWVKARARLDSLFSAIAKAEESAP